MCRGLSQGAGVREHHVLATFDAFLKASERP